MPNVDQKENVYRGIVVIVATVFAMAFADAIVKYVSSSLPLWQIFVVRSLIAIPILTLIFCLHKNVDIRSHYIGWTLLRSFLLAFMYIGIYAAAPIISLSIIAGSLYTGPLFIAMFSSLFLNERVGPIRWAAILTGFVGVLIVIQPQSSEFHVAMLVPISAAIFYALAAIITRSKCSKEHPIALAMYLNYVLLFVGLMMTVVLSFESILKTSSREYYPFLLGGWIVMGWAEWTVLCFLAVLIVAIGIGLAVAYQSARAAIIATFDYSYLIFAAFWSYIFFMDTPTGATLLGILFIFISGVLVTFSDRIEKLILDNNKAMGI